MGFLDAIVGTATTIGKTTTNAVGPVVNAVSVSPDIAVSSTPQVLPDAINPGINPPDAQPNERPKETASRIAADPKVAPPRKKMLKGDLLEECERLDKEIVALEKQLTEVQGLREREIPPVFSSDLMVQDGYRVYINCVPTEAPCAHLYKLLAPLEEQARLYKTRIALTGDPSDKHEDYPHYLLTPFSRGPSLVAALLLSELATLTGNIVVDAFHPAASACMTVLLSSPRCLDVIRPIR